MIKPKQITLTDMDGQERTFNISRVPAMQGRRIFTQYVTTATPKIGDYNKNEELMLLMMSHVEAKMGNGEYIPLRTAELVSQHTGDWETLCKLEMEMVKYNTDFFHPEKISRALTAFKARLPEQIMSMLSQCLASLSQKGKQH